MTVCRQRVPRFPVRRLGFLPAVAWLTAQVSCTVLPPAGDGDGGGSGVFHNTTDATNGGATYVGSSACKACHPNIAQTFDLHGHAHALTAIEGQAPAYPAAATRAGVPDPPDGFAWSDIAYVVGGHIRDAKFVDLAGFLLTTGETGVDTQWDLDFPANGNQAGFVPYESARTDPLPYEYDCFRCHTTGASPVDIALPRNEENRPGLVGTFQEPGVQCEVCHGPGGNHIPNPSARDLYVNSSASVCGECHTRDGDRTVIQAADGFIRNNQQWAELSASGGHAGFNCTMCHEPHTSMNYDRDKAFRNQCTACHADQSMALHAGKVFVRGDYTEALSCESCHMPFATKSASSGGAGVVDAQGRVGDMRTHIFRINPVATDAAMLFTPDGSAVATDESGRAAVPVNFVCLRCHIGDTPDIDWASILAGVADGIHER